MAAARKPVACTSLRILLALGLGLAFGPARACGHCIEDRIAAVYDHAWSSRMLAQRHHVAYFALDGRLAARSDQTARIERAVAGSRGVDPGSVRISVDAAALSLSFDPARTSAAQLRQSLQRRLMPQGLAVQTLRIMVRPGEFVSEAAD